MRQDENVQRLLRDWRGASGHELWIRARGLRMADAMGLLSVSEQDELRLIHDVIYLRYGGCRDHC